MCMYFFIHCWILRLFPFLATINNAARNMRVVIVQSLTNVWLCDPMDWSTPGFPVLHYLLELAQTHVHWVGDAIQPSHLLSSPSPPAFNLSQHQGLSQWQFLASGGQNIGVSASASVLPINIQNWFPLGLIALIALQSKGLSRVFSNTSSKASILWHSAFFIVQLSHLYTPTGKTIALTRWTFVGKVMSLLLNILSRLVITFLPRSKRLLISWLQSPSIVILEPKKIKSLTVSIVSPSICHEVILWDYKQSQHTCGTPPYHVIISIVNKLCHSLFPILDRTFNLSQYGTPVICY